MSTVIHGVLIAAVLAAITIFLSLKSGSPALLKNFHLIKAFLLVIAAIFSCFLALFCLAAAAWGMDTRLPWGLGILMYLIPVLSLPAFVILIFGSVRTLSQVLWFITVASSLTFYFGAQAEQVVSGWHPITNFAERIGMFANAFTDTLIGIAGLVQVASLCASREKLSSHSGEEA